MTTVLLLINYFCLTRQKKQLGNYAYHEDANLTNFFLFTLDANLTNNMKYLVPISRKSFFERISRKNYRQLIKEVTCWTRILLPIYRQLMYL